MQIAIDVDDIRAIRRRLETACEDLGEATPVLPNASVFGSQVLAGAVASFESEILRQLHSTRERWHTLDAEVQASFDDMSAVEDEIISLIGRLETGLDAEQRHA